MGNGTGLTPAEQYTAYSPGNLSSTTPIQPGQTTILKSALTGLYCELQPSPANSSQTVMVCDLATAAGASVMTYTGSGLSYQGQALVPNGAGGQLVLANQTTQPLGASATNMSFPLAATGV